MRTGTAIGGVAAALLLATAVTFADAKHEMTGKPNQGFDRMKSLVGEWKGTTKEGKTVKASYSLISDNSALMETLSPEGEPGMVTIYHPDRDALMMTHYCGAHNQPRMRAEGVTPESKSITFNFVDATNLASPDDGRMDRLVLRFLDAGHMSQEWTWKDKDGGKGEVFKMERVK